MYKHLILAVGMPRSGTSWLGQVLNSCPNVCLRLSPLFSYEFKNCVNETSPKSGWEYMFAGAYKANSEFMEQRVRVRDGEYPVFDEKAVHPTHLAIKDTRFHNLLERALSLFDNLKVVAIVRHPCGSIHSWITNKHEFPPHCDPLKEWRSGSCRKSGFGEFWGFEDWKLVTRLHMKLASEMPGRVIIQSYKDLVLNPLQETQRLFQFCGLEYTKQTDEFMKNSQKKHHPGDYAVFKTPDVMDRWKTELQSDISNAVISELTGSDLERFLR